MSEAKPYNISKHLVWQAWKQVKANQGAAGVDGVSIAAFEKDLKRNLYKVWNRMSSGAYFPPPVRLVEIPKSDGKSVRKLGIPAIGDRVAQTVILHGRLRLAILNSSEFVRICWDSLEHTNRRCCVMLPRTEERCSDIKGLPYGEVATGLEKKRRSGWG